MKSYCLNCKKEIHDGQTFCQECRDATASLIETILSKRGFISKRAEVLIRIAELGGLTLDDLVKTDKSPKKKEIYIA